MHRHIDIYRFIYKRDGHTVQITGGTSPMVKKNRFSEKTTPPHTHAKNTGGTNPSVTEDCVSIYTRTRHKTHTHVHTYTQLNLLMYNKLTGAKCVWHQSNGKEGLALHKTQQTRLRIDVELCTAARDSTPTAPV